MLNTINMPREARQGPTMLGLRWPLVGWSVVFGVNSAERDFRDYFCRNFHSLHPLVALRGVVIWFWLI